MKNTAIPSQWAYEAQALKLIYSTGFDQNTRSFQSVISNSGQKMALRALYVLIC